MDVRKTAREIGLFETGINLARVLGSPDVLAKVDLSMPLPDEDIADSVPQIAAWLRGFGKRKYLFLTPEIALIEEMARLGQPQEEVTLVLPWDLANPGKGSRVPDPIAYLSSDNDVQELARQIARGNPEYQRATRFDPYWKDASEALMTGLIYYVLVTQPKPSMKQVIDTFYQLRIMENGKGICTSLDSQFAWLERRAPDSVAVRKFRSFSQLPYVTASCVRDDLEKSIQTMFPVSIQAAMSGAASVSFEDFATSRTAIFILTSPFRTAQYAFANLLFSIAIRQLVEFAETRENQRLPRDVKLFFDDFGCGFPIQNYEKAISTFRSAGISSMMLCQSLSQLDATYGQDGSTVILDNCSTLVYLPGGLNQKTGAYISGMSGLPLDEVLFMEMGNVVVFQSGKPPLIAPRYDTLADPVYQQFMAAGTAVGAENRGAV